MLLELDNITYKLYYEYRLEYSLSSKVISESMTKKIHTNFEEFENELLQDPEIRKEYESLKPKYEMIQRLIKRRNQLRMSQSQLARTVGTRQPAISRLERGDFNNITLSTLIKVAHALDLDLDISLKARRSKIVACSKATA